MLIIQSEKGGAGQGGVEGQPGRGGREEHPSGVLLPGAAGIEADTEIGIGDGAHDGLVHLTGQAPLTGTLVVNPIERLQRHRASGVTGWWGAPLGIALPRGPDPENTRPASLFSLSPPDCDARGRCGTGGRRFWFLLRLICAY